MSEYLKPSDTRKAIRKFVFSNAGGVTAKQLINKSISARWSLLVDPIEYTIESLGALGLTTFDKSTGKVKPLA